MDSGASGARAARDAVADAHILGVVAFLMDVDPDGAWSPRDGEQSLRERAADLAVQGVVDDIIDAADLAGMLAVRS